MKKCSENCYDICDFCINCTKYVEISGALLFAWCETKNKLVDPEESCNGFECFNIPRLEEPLRRIVIPQDIGVEVDSEGRLVLSDSGVEVQELLLHIANSPDLRVPLEQRLGVNHFSLVSLLRFLGRLLASEVAS